MHADVERLARVYPTLPEGKAKDLYAERVNDAVHALNTRLDPLFKGELRRKRKVVATVFTLVFVGSFLVLPNVDGGSIKPFETVLGLILGGVVLVAFLFIERDTKTTARGAEIRQRGPEMTPPSLAAALPDDTRSRQ